MRRSLSALVLGLCTAVTSADDQPMTRTVESQGYRVTLDLRGQVLSLNIPEDRDYWDEEEDAAPRDAEVLPRLPEVHGGFVSAAMLAEKAKQFDDGLYAAVEFAAQKGIGKFGGKAYVLKAITDALLRDAPPEGPDDATATLLAAARLGDLPLVLPPTVQSIVEQRLAGFDAQAVLSKPIGFYTWSRNLESIFCQDRMLQSELTGARQIGAIAAALTADAKARGTYEAYLALNARLTNPVSKEKPKPDLRTLLGKGSAAATTDKGVWFFPPSRAHESELFFRMFGANAVPPEDFDLADELIKRIRSGDIDLTPTPESGWYDHQTWSLETLVRPEAAAEAKKLALSDAYKRHLVDLFKGILARTRETHIKQLEIPIAMAAAPRDAEISIRPELSAEPLATFYLRRALSYRFVRGVLEDTFGAEALAKMHRWTADGPLEDRTLADELKHMESLFVGAYVRVCGDLGLTPELPAALGDHAPAIAAAAFTQWAGSAAADVDLGRDGRMMVPVFHDAVNNRTKVWAFLGWSTRRLAVLFEERPQAEIVSASDGKPAGDRVHLDFDSASYSVPYPVMAEVYVKQIMTRGEFAAHCDKHKTRKAILENLK